MKFLFLLFILIQSEMPSPKVAVLYHSYEGKFHDPPVIEDEMREYFRSGEVNFIRYLINKDQSTMVAKL
ncbi:MAG: hypothetical protein AB7I27_18975 [Bacteriovoracaceae bacterium]